MTNLIIHTYSHLFIEGRARENKFLIINMPIVLYNLTLLFIIGKKLSYLF